MRRPGFTVLLHFALSAVAVHAYQWPNPLLDELEAMRYNMFGYNQHVIADTLAGGLAPCSNPFSATDIQGRSNAADWIRNAYHDMATHNRVDGTGGLDGSTQFEQDRPENAGVSFRNSALFFGASVNRYSSFADIAAYAATFAIELCGGPNIALRGGRVDAVVPNNPGVPKPEQSLEEHVASFDRQGFSSDEMIGLVACGHAFGGVERQFFPDIVPSPDASDENANVDATFDTTPFTFDNNIATEYVVGSTQNPLVVSPNTTMRSDLRIFSSDNNKTMKAFAKDPQLFRSTCATLFARMLDTVPKETKLTEVIRPLPVKPAGVEVIPTEGGGLALQGDVRFWDMPENPARVIKVFWADRTGNTCDGCSATLTHTSDQTSMWKVTDEQHSALWYTIDPRLAVIDPAQGLSKIWFTVTENGRTIMHDQGGVGFGPIQDTLLFSEARSCIAFVPEKQAEETRLKIAVRVNAVLDGIWVESDSFDRGKPRVFNTNITLQDPKPIGGGVYTEYQAVLPVLSGSTLNLAASAAGVTYRTPFRSNFSFNMTTCA